MEADQKKDVAAAVGDAKKKYEKEAEKLRKQMKENDETYTTIICKLEKEIALMEEALEQAKQKGVDATSIARKTIEKEMRTKLEKAKAKHGEVSFHTYNKCYSYGCHIEKNKH